MPRRGASQVTCSPSAGYPSLGQLAGVRHLRFMGAGAVGVRAQHWPHGARSCKLSLHACGGGRWTSPGGAPHAFMKGFWI